MAKRSSHLRATRRKPTRRSLCLTWTELRKLRRDVLADLKARGIPNVVDVGIGQKNPFRKRGGGLSLLFVVNKRVPEAKLERSQILGKSRRFEVRVGTGKRQRWVNLASDVVTSRTVRAVPIAASVALGDVHGTAGMILRWTKNGQQRWGVLTAGHVIMVSGIPAPALSASDGNDIASVAIAFRPKATDLPFDAGVLSVARGDVANLNSTVDPVNAIGLRPDDNIDFNEGSCRTRLSGDVAVDIRAAFAVNISIEGWTNVKSLLGFRPINGSSVAPFAKGNSGSAVVDQSGAPLGVLIAADEVNFATGFAQPLSEMIAYVKSQMQADTMEIIGLC